MITQTIGQLLRLFSGLLLALAMVPAGAHETMPASLMLRELSAGLFEVHWRVPQTQGAAPDIAPSFPSHCESTSAPVIAQLPTARLTTWQMHCTKGLAAPAGIRIQRLELTTVDTLVHLTYLNGSEESHIARPRTPEVVLGKEAAASLSVSSYFGLGVTHILGGTDHLLFVLCLILLISTLKGLLTTITAFTLAHSITLALSAFNVVHLAQPPVEATIALSILFLARELVLMDTGERLTARRPWAIAFVFGLLHGFGFAGALAEVGLPHENVSAALLLFNLGVEAGQLAFVACVVPLVFFVRRAQVVWPHWARAAPVYAVGAVAGYWWLDRILPVLGLASAWA